MKHLLKVETKEARETKVASYLAKTAPREPIVVKH